MLPSLTRARQAAKNASPALKFVVMVGIMSFFADFTYEGSRSITGPHLGMLGAGAFAISVISGAGEFLGYNIRMFSGRGADRTGRYWPITIGGYILQMSVVPLLALAGNWQVAALLPLFRAAEVGIGAEAAHPVHDPGQRVPRPPGGRHPPSRPVPCCWPSWPCWRRPRRSVPWSR